MCSQVSPSKLSVNIYFCLSFLVWNFLSRLGLTPIFRFASLTLFHFRAMLTSMFLDGGNIPSGPELDVADGEWLLRDILTHGIMALMAMGAVDEAGLWLSAGWTAGVYGMPEALVQAVRWQLRSSPAVSLQEVWPLLHHGYCHPEVRGFGDKLLRLERREKAAARRGSRPGRWLSGPVVQLLEDSWSHVQESRYTNQQRQFLLPNLHLPVSTGAVVPADWSGWQAGTGLH